MQYWCDVYTETNRIRSLLHTCSDIPRIAQLITQKKRSVFWLRSLGEHLMHVYAHDFFVDAFTRYTDTQISKRLHEIGKYLTSLISDESTSEDDWIVVGYDAEVDKLRHYDEVIEKQLLDYQQQWITRSGVAVKVKYITNQ